MSRPCCSCFSRLASALTILAMAGRPLERVAPYAQRLPLVQTTLAFLRGADGRLVRNPRVLGTAIGLQGAIVLLDAATVWTLIGALGVSAPVTGVFASFMIASLFRTMGIVPGGLGMFEATSVLTLRMAGVDLAVALSATLLFRGLSFWLPMVPGYWFSRRVLARRPSDSRRLAAPASWSVEPRAFLTDFRSRRRTLGSSTDQEMTRTTDVAFRRRSCSLKRMFLRKRPFWLPTLRLKSKSPETI